MPLNALLIQTPIIAQGGRVSEPWRVFFRDQETAIAQTTTQTIPPITLTAQAASIGVTPIPTPSLAPGYYRVSYYARVTTVGSVSSSLTVTVSWTDGGVACSASGAAITGNTVASTGTGSFLLLIDEATPISYSTTYASNLAGEMQYQLGLTLEEVGLLT